MRAGEKLFPGITGPSFADKLRSAASQFGRGRADRLGTRSIRRGDARAILEAGGSFAQLLEAARWRFSAFPLPLDFVVGDTEAMAPILIAAPDDEGPGRREPGKDGAP